MRSHRECDFKNLGQTLNLWNTDIPLPNGWAMAVFRDVNRGKMMARYREYPVLWMNHIFNGPFKTSIAYMCSLYAIFTVGCSLSLTAYCYTPAKRSLRGVILDSPCPSVRPSVCRRHGFRSISQVCFGISISNFICMLMVVIGRSLLIFSDVTFKMADWWPYWIFWFPDSNFSLAMNINSKLQWHNTYVYG